MYAHAICNDWPYRPNYTSSPVQLRDHWDSVFALDCNPPSHKRGRGVRSQENNILPSR